MEHYSEDGKTFEDEIADFMDLRQVCLIYPLFMSVTEKTMKSFDLNFYGLGQLQKHISCAVSCRVHFILVYRWSERSFLTFLPPTKYSGHDNDRVAQKKDGLLCSFTTCEHMLLSYIS